MNIYTSTIATRDMIERLTEALRDVVAEREIPLERLAKVEDYNPIVGEIWEDACERVGHNPRVGTFYVF